MPKRMLVLVVALAIAAAACSGGGDTADGVASLDDVATDLAAGDVAVGDAATTEVAASDEEALLAFAQCMRDQGIELEDPTVDEDGNVRLAPPNDAVARDGQGRFGGEEGQAAFEQCSSHLEGVTLGFRDRDRTEIQDRLLEFAACMRGNGFDMPDPDFTNVAPGQGGGPFGAIDRDDPAFVSAQEVCSDILAGFRRPGAGPGGGGGDG